MALSEGGRRAATCRLLKPPQEIPNMPVWPVHHGWAASQASTSSGVVLFLGEVLVEQNALGVAAAAQVDPHARVAVSGEVRMPGRVADRRPVALAVGDVLEQGGHRVAFGVLGEPDLGGEPAAVRKRDPLVLDHADGPGKSARDSFPCKGEALGRERAQSLRVPNVMGPRRRGVLGVCEVRACVVGVCWAVRDS